MSATPDTRSTPFHAEPSTTLAPPGVGPDVSPAPPGDSKPPLPESVVAASSAPGVNAARARTPTPTPPPASSLLFKAPSESNRGSPSRSPRRIETDPTDLQSHDDLKAGRGYKRIIVCCDGTWQDGISSTRAQYTNVLRLSRAVNYIDERFQPPIPQIVYYQSGVGTDPGILSRMFDGATGSTLVDKVEEAYAFIAHNYAPGDEIFLFGFSRGAYTARMIAMLIGEIGVLDRRDMDYFASIFVNFQALGKNPNKEDKVRLEKDLHRWRKPDAVGRKRADCDGDKFTVKCVGVWDTVGALGLPDELFLLKFGSKAHKLFGFVDRHLGGHVERAYQALALNEKRKDFNCTKFEQVDANAKRRGQILKQCWFTGAHTDVGGGYEDHDLADLSLTWMAAQVSDILSLDAEYLLHLIEPSAPWGEQQPHDSATGIFVLAWKSPRDLPVYPRDETTQETIHPSVLKQSSINPALCELIEKDPGIVCDLLPFERQVQAKWAVDLASEHVKAYEKKKTLSMENVPPELVAHEVVVTSKSWFSKTITRTFSQKKKGPKVNSEAKPEHKRRLSGNLWAPETKTANIGKEKENRR